jgi:hypothetical protein
MSTPHSIIGRAEFLTRIGGLLAAAVIGPSDFRRVLDETAELEHPEPREGITGDHVLAATALGKVRDQKVVDAYEAARAFPAIFDGIACGCSCSGMNAKSGQHRSLLVCYETLQPTGCGSCQLEAATVSRLAKDGASLADIRKEVDKTFR